jgi:hypothetical protein
MEELPIRWSWPLPDHYHAVSEAERESADLQPDFCAIGQHFFIRGMIEIPLQGSDEPFGWGVWCSLSAASMEKVQSVWEDDDRDRHGPFFGWLNTSLPLYPPTAILKTHVHLRAPPFIPVIEIEPSDHPLSIEQRAGMTMERAVEIAEALLPRH